MTEQTNETKIFAVGDIHGSHDKLISLLQRLKIDKDRDCLVFLGDYINRGPESRKVIDTLLEIQRSFANSVFLKGNHEQALLTYAETGDVDLVPFLRMMGIEATASSYGARVRSLRNLSCFPQSHRDFLTSLQFCYVAGNYIFTHADLPDTVVDDLFHGRPVEKPDKQQEGELLASRCLVEGETGIPDTTVIFGHSPFELPLVLHDRICIDTGAVYDNILTALELPKRQFTHA